MNKLLCIIGPTATGKTDLGITLAKKLNGELVSCDSRQVYRGLDIGTGKLPCNDVEYTKHNKVWLIDSIPVWLYDIVDPKVRYDVWQYVQDAAAIVEQINQSGKLPIIVGGTGMYLKGLLEGFSEMEIPVDPKLRQELEQLNPEDLRQKLKKIDLPQFKLLNNSELHNKRRLIRRIEKLLMSKELSQPQINRGIGNKYEVLKIGLTADREVLNKRIDQRVIKRVNAGMIKEAENLYQEGLSYERMKQLGLEYGLLSDLLEGLIDKNEFIKKLQFRIHQYAKRQLTWFNRDNKIKWFDITGPDFEQKVEQTVLGWYNEQNKRA